MKTLLVQNEKTEKLTIFFAGWGMDFTPFSSYKLGNDFLFCYDYTTLDFPEKSILKNYGEIKVVAWSMGVWAAGILLDETLPLVIATAINGTPFPIDDRRGIPVEIFNATLNNLNETSLQKFYRRMCGGKKAFELFAEISPKRTVESLKTELSAIKENSELPQNPIWTNSIIGKRDMIFPAENQLNVFPNAQIFENSAHYDDSILRQTLGVIS